MLTWISLLLTESLSFHNRALSGQFFHLTRHSSNVTYFVKSYLVLLRVHRLSLFVLLQHKCLCNSNRTHRHCLTDLLYSPFTHSKWRQMSLHGPFIIIWNYIWYICVYIIYVYVYIHVYHENDYYIIISYIDIFYIIIHIFSWYSLVKNILVPAY